MMLPDDNWIGQPLDLGSDLRAEIANTVHLVGILRDRGNSARASAVGEYVHGLLDRTLAAKVIGPVACAKGCHHCCHTYVSATIPEILRLARVVRANGLAAKDIDIAATRAKEIGQDARFLNRVSCPLLDDGACAAYGGRPLACRTMLSRSLDACLRYFPLNGSGALDYAPGAREARGRVEIILLAALSISGLTQDHIELTQGLSVALAQPDAEERWLAGEPVFADVAADTAEGLNEALTTWVPILTAAVRRIL